MPSKKYQSSIESNSAFMMKMEELVKEIIIQNNVPYYRIESRMDHQHSSSGENIYMPVIRVITYFEDSVSKISEIIGGEFDVVNERSKDKKKIRLDSFSYKHIQLTAALKPTRQELIEYRRSGTKKFEIHVCSMLQDAWAGIERELGYENATFPEDMKRDFYRVGALLEMADLEFLKIRSQLNSKYGWVEPSEDAQAPMHEAHEVHAIAPVAPQPQPAPVVAPVQLQTEQFIPQQVANVNGNQKPQELTLPTPVPVAVPEPVFQTPVAPIVEEVKPAPVATPEPVYQAPVAPVVEEVKPAPVVVPEPVFEAPVAPVLAAPPVVEEIMPAPAESMDVVRTAVPEIDNKVEEVNNQVDEVKEITDSVPALSAETVNVAANTVNVASHNTYINSVDGANNVPVVKSDEPVAFYDREPEPAKAAATDENSQMTDATLKHYVQNSKIIKEVDSDIAKRAGATLNNEVDVEGDVERLKYLKVYSLKQLHERVLDNKNDIVAFAEKWIGKDNGGSFDSGICLFYLEYLLVGKKNDPAFAVEYVLKFISDNDYSARFIIPTYNSISKNEKPIASHLTLK